MTGSARRRQTYRQTKIAERTLGKVARIASLVAMKIVASSPGSGKSWPLLRSHLPPGRRTISVESPALVRTGRVGDPHFED
jgi:hypothetical protein